MEKEILELIGLIYNAAEDPSRWPDFLQRYANVLNFHIAQFELITSDSTASVSISVGMNEADQRDFSRYSFLNPWIGLIQLAAPGTVGASHEHVDYRGYVKGAYYQEFGKRIDQHYGQAGLIIRTDSAISILGAVRSKSVGPCGSRETGIFQALMPHLARALRMQMRLAQSDAQAASLMECLNRLACGVVLLNQRGRLLRANQAAERMAAQDDGLHLSARGLRAHDLAESAALTQLIFEAVQTSNGKGLSSGGTLKISRTSLRRPWIAVVSPHKTASGDGLAAVLLIDPDEKPVPSATIISQMFGFTRSEARLARLLAAGVRLEDAAGELRITVNTARTHARRMLDKAGVRRQTDLVLLLNRVPADDSPA
jgi:DNA-binding CsgD family transcriptional regulator/PAS domain-containing protein